MTKIRVTTQVDISDETGELIMSIIKTETAKPGDNPRFWAIYTRGAIQGTEHYIANALINAYGDKP